MKPLIGIIAYKMIREGTPLEYDVCYGANATAIEKAGGLPILIPSGLSLENLRAIYQRVDAILLPGGGDVDPQHYQAEKHPKTDYIDHRRDETEINIARWAVDDDLPVLGICRGQQVLNVALGGTLLQDIPSLVETEINHSQPRTARQDIIHKVEIDADSRLAEVLGTTTVEVNSLHHQAVEKPAPNMRVTSYSPDGVVESIELPDKEFVLAVQWHPEDLVSDEVMMRLFRAFVDTARERLLRRA